MEELNGNEKFHRLSKGFPSKPQQVATIHNGELLLWESDTVVLFYETFSTSYSYTRIGKIDDPDGLAKAVGSGNVTVQFSKPKS